MTNTERIKALLIMYDDSFNKMDIKNITFCKDGRILLFANDTVTQIPTHLLQNFSKEVIK